LAFLANIDGLTFEFMRERHSYGYVWALGLMAVCAIAMAAAFTRRGWW
jgi:Mg2+ and Co2+ transporter CorA